ncbi:MAG: DUF1343 domain-containing protein [Capsulimonadaceae bacterium]
MTNHTGLTRGGRATADVLNVHPGVELRALFGPEHGIRGELDAGVPDSIDRATGLPAFSLYGERNQPTAEQLADIDTLIYDIQDIGCRFYTYISTLANVMEAAARHGKRIIVLDRPNPISGVHVEGTLADTDRLSFVACHTIPVRHGMTAGEIAHLLRAERRLTLDLVVILCEGWRRKDWFDATGLVWTNPSPNMRSLAAATLYPGIGLLEMTNVSVGRGTGTPFEVVGAPWVDPQPFAEALNGAGLAGVRFIPVRFVPERSVFEGESCGGANLLVTDRSAFDSVRTGLELAAVLRRLYPDHWQREKLITLLANREAFDLIESGGQGTVDDLTRLCRRDIDSFRARRQGALLYS